MAHDNNLDKLRLAFRDAITVLQKEVAVRFGIKWYFALKLTFRKAIDDDVVTDPPVVLNTDPVMGLIGNNYENDLDKVFQKILQQIDDFETNGSGWITDNVITMYIYNIIYAVINIVIYYNMCYIYIYIYNALENSVFPLVTFVLLNCIHLPCTLVSS